jgi:hypothetical protein
MSNTSWFCKFEQIFFFPKLFIDDELSPELTNFFTLFQCFPVQLIKNLVTNSWKKFINFKCNLTPKRGVAGAGL